MRTRIAIIAIGLGLCVLLGAVRVAAHHAFAAEFDGNKPVSLKGTVTKMEWTNPHSWIYIDVKKDNGTVEKWMIEVGAPNAMYRRGFTKNSLPVGSELIIEGYQALDGDLRANGKTVTFTDGRRIFVGAGDQPR